MKAPFCLGLLIFLRPFSPIFAATSPPSLPVDSMSWKPQSVNKPAAGLHIGSFDIEFEKTTLARVLGAVGSGTIQHQGDAGESIYWVCYTTNKDQRLWFVSSGEMGGTEHAVTSIAAQQIERVKSSPDCPALPAKLQPVSLQHGLWVGASDEVALQSLGVPSYYKDPWRYFEYESKVKGDCQPDGFDIVNWVAYKLGKGKVITVMAGQVTSC